MLGMNNIHVKSKDINYYSNKIDKYITLINTVELTDNEKELIKKKLNNINKKLESIKRSEELNIKTINNVQDHINKDKLLIQYRSYLTNKNLYLKLKKENNIPNTFKYLYECYEYVNKQIPLHESSFKYIEDINKDNIDISKDFNIFIQYFNDHYTNETLFDQFLI